LLLLLLLLLLLADARTCMPRRTSAGHASDVGGRLNLLLHVFGGMWAMDACFRVRLAVAEEVSRSSHAVALQAICSSTPLALKVAAGGPGFALAEYLNADGGGSASSLRARQLAALQALRVACLNRADVKSVIMMFGVEQVVHLACEVPSTAADLAPQTGLLLDRAWNLLLTWAWGSEENQKVLLERGGLSAGLAAVFSCEDEAVCPATVVKVALDCLVQMKVRRVLSGGELRRAGTHTHTHKHTHTRVRACVCHRLLVAAAQ
jgi:hypothetical protein